MSPKSGAVSVLVPPHDGHNLDVRACMHVCMCVSMCEYVNVSVFSGAELFMHRVVPLYVDDPVLHRLQLTEGLKVSLEGAACLGDTLRCQVILHLFVHFRSQFAVAELSLIHI